MAFFKPAARTNIPKPRNAADPNSVLLRSLFLPGKSKSTVVPYFIFAVDYFYLGNDNGHWFIRNDERALLSHEKKKVFGTIIKFVDKGDREVPIGRIKSNNIFLAHRTRTTNLSFFR